jgi:hypothetical protein
MPGEIIQGQGAVVAIDQGLVVLVDALTQATAVSGAGPPPPPGGLLPVLQADSGFRGD